MLLQRAATRLTHHDRAVWAAGCLILLVAIWSIGNALLPNQIPIGVVVHGIVIGSLYALTAMGLVLIYRTARAINFAQAEMGSIGASSAIIAVQAEHWNFFVAIIVGIAIAMLTGLVADSLISWRWARAPRLVLTVVTIGLQQLLGAAAEGMALPFHIQLIQNFSVPTKALGFSIGAIAITSNETLVLIVVPFVLAGVWLFLEKTLTGAAIRASADSPERALLLGIPVRRLSRIVWMIAAGISGIGAILAAPITFPSVGVVAGPSALLIPLAAAIVGGMESLTTAFFAAVVLGIFQQAMYWSYPKSPTVDLGMFIVVIGALILQPFTPAARARRTRQSDAGIGDYVAFREIRPIPEILRRLPEVRISKVAIALAALAAAVFVPMGLSASNLVLITNIAIFSLIAISLVVLAGWSGQLSFGQFAFVGVGAAVTGALVVSAHLDLLVALVVSAAAGAAVAIVIGLPALRLQGLFLAVATLAFAVPVSTWLMNQSNFPALNPDINHRPVLFGRIPLDSSLAFYELALVVLVLAILLVHNLRKSRAGRAIIAVRENSHAAASFTISPIRTKLLAFALSGAIAGLAGGLYFIGLEGGAGYPPEQSLMIFVMVVFGGLGSVGGAVLGAVYVEVVLTYLPSAWQLLATGAGILFVLAIIPEGLGNLAYRLRDMLVNLAARRRGLNPTDLTLAPAAGPAGAHPDQAERELATQKAAIRLQALEQLEEAERQSTTDYGRQDRADSASGASAADRDGAPHLDTRTGTPVGTPGKATAQHLRGPAEGGIDGSGGGTVDEDHDASTPQPAPAVACLDLAASYGSMKVLSRVNVTVNSGEVLAILGTNGAGKTTLLRVLAGLTPAAAGSVMIAGMDATSWDPIRRVREGLVMVPGGHGVFPSLTVSDNLRLGGWSITKSGKQRSHLDNGNGHLEPAPSRDIPHSREARAEQLSARLDQVLKLFPALSARMDLRAGLLSGGEQQMLALAQSLLCMPTLLMIDELSLGLAPTVVSTLLDALRDMAAVGTTVVIVEQSVNVASAIARRAVFLERGRVQFSGPTPDLGSQPQLLRSVFVRAASRATPRQLGAAASSQALVTGILSGTGGAMPGDVVGVQGTAPSVGTVGAVPAQEATAPEVTGGTSGLSVEDILTGKVAPAGSRSAAAPGVPAQDTGTGTGLAGSASTHEPDKTVLAPPAGAHSAVQPAGEATGSPAQDGRSTEPTNGSGSAPEPALEARGVRMSYGGIRVLEGVDLSVSRSEIVGIIGVNGSGKTTLFDICCGFLTPTAGQVFMDGHDVTGEPPHKRASRGLGRVFQNAGVFPSMTVSEALATAVERFVEVRDPLLGALSTLAASRSEKAIRLRVAELLEELNLTQWRDTFVSELSMGTRRIVELASVMAHQPSLLLLDEPSSGIAQRESEALGELLVSLRDRTGAAFVVIEHDVPLVASIADRLACLHLGGILIEGTPSEVLNDQRVIAAYLGLDETAVMTPPADPAARRSPELV